MSTPAQEPVHARLRFFAGSLEVRPHDAAFVADLVARGGRVDAREACVRFVACQYAEVVLALRDSGVPVTDDARRYDILEPERCTRAQTRKAARPFQREALTAWERARGQGVVVLPTGAGKTHVAIMAIAAKARSALVVTPTLDLVRQWHAALQDAFGDPVGILGGGEHTLLPLTVSTYDSAWAHMEHYGARFGTVVFDEAHHLVAESYALSAQQCLAPFRLGLTATPERPDGRHTLLDTLCGRIVYRKEIDELEGEYLSAYDTERIDVVLDATARAQHDAARAQYLGFLRSNGIDMSRPSGFSDFLKRGARSPEGRAAVAAYRLQRSLAFAAPQKLDVVEELLARHPQQRTLLFTDDNATALKIARRFLVPLITHETKVRERAAILDAFKSGALPVLASSRVLNEGVDVPDAQVAVIVSGTGSVREHVQRLGRVLRPRAGKRAILYELVTAQSGEDNTSERRRDHVAYR